MKMQLFPLTLSVCGILALSLPVAAKDGPPSFQTLSAQEYETLLEQADVNRLAQDLGAVSLAIKTDWFPEGQQVWTDIKIANLPNMAYMKEPAAIMIESIQNAAGEEIGTERTLDGEQTLFAQPAGVDADYISASKMLELKSAYNVTDVASVKGKLVLRLPIGVHSISVTKDDVGQEKTLGPHTFTLQKMEDITVQYQHTGGNGEAFKTRAHNEAGEEVSFSSSMAGNMGGQVNETVTYETAPASLSFAIAEEVIVKEYPFHLK